MTPTEARVGIVEDDPGARELLVMYLTRGNHLVAAIAKNRQEARTLIESLNPGDLDVIVLDANLGGSRLVDGSDGKEILKIMSECNLAIPVIGMSSNPFPGTTVDLGKDNMDKISGVIDKL